MRAHFGFRLAIVVAALGAGPYQTAPARAAARPTLQRTAAVAPPVVMSWGANAPFSNILVGDSVVGQFFFGTYNVPITLTGATLTGPSPDNYSIVSNTCTAGVVLQGNGVCEVDVKFAPNTPTYEDEFLELTTTTGPFEEDIGANGLLQSILLSPTFIDFGTVPLGTTAKRTLTLTNPNPIAVSFEYDYYAPFGAGFMPDGSDCGPLPAKSSCTYTIDFMPPYAGEATGSWNLITNVDPEGNDFTTSQVKFAGIGVNENVTAIDISKFYNTEAIGVDSGHVAGGGLDGLGNVYAADLLATPLVAANQAFTLGKPDGLDAVSDVLLPVTPGNYYGLTLLATAVRGNQPNQVFTVNYADGSTLEETQSLSDWHTPQHYAGESIAVTTAYRLTIDGVRQKGSFSLYTYTLPVDHDKVVVGVRLPYLHTVNVLALNANLIGVPATADLSPLYNVAALGKLYSTVGIDGLGNAIDLGLVVHAPASFTGTFGNVSGGYPNAVANVTVPLPAGTYASLRLFGLAVRGNHPDQSMTINYKDGTHTVLHQSFSDWHTPQGYSGESIALAMTDRIDAQNELQSGEFNIYQYDLPIDPSKLVDSLVLPATRQVVIMQVTVEP